MLENHIEVNYFRSTNFNVYVHKINIADTFKNF